MSLTRRGESADAPVIARFRRELGLWIEAALDETAGARQLDQPRAL
jgi:hypothetical protein